MIVVYFLVWAGVGGLIGYAIGNSKGRGAEGFWLGLLLGIIGWIVVAFMAPSDAVTSERAAIATVIQGQAQDREERGRMRPCPWCAEPIRPEARVCRFCGRDVEPASPESEIERVAREHPDSFAEALAFLDQLGEKPIHPADWLNELCRRIEAGSPPQAAAARIGLDWTGSPAAPPRSTPNLAAAQSGDLAEEGDGYPEVASDFPVEYPAAIALLARLPETPARPGAWLSELCKRMAAGSPPEAAAALIPLDQ